MLYHWQIILIFKEITINIQKIFFKLYKTIFDFNLHILYNNWDLKIIKCSEKRIYYYEKIKYYFYKSSGVVFNNQHALLNIIFYLKSHNKYNNYKYN